MKRVNGKVLEFIEYVVAQTAAIQNGDFHTANRHAVRYVRAFETLTARGDSGRDLFVPLLSHERADVRAMAAAFLLRYRHDTARSVLEEVSRGEGLTAFAAGETLLRWEEGSWHLDPG